MKYTEKLITAIAVFAGWQALSSTIASAATVSYIFLETGWVNMFGTSETLFGSLSGTSETGGTVALADLSSFSATMTESNAQGDTKTLAAFDITEPDGLGDFIYVPNSNSLTLEATASPGTQVCLGDAVTAGLCGAVPPRPQPRPGTPPAPPIEGLFSFSVNGELNAYTLSLPVVAQTLSIRPVPAPVTTPEPATLGLCGGALVLFSKLLRRRGRP